MINVYYFTYGPSTCMTGKLFVTRSSYSRRIVSLYSPISDRSVIGNNNPLYTKT